MPETTNGLSRKVSSKLARQLLRIGHEDWFYATFKMIKFFEKFVLRKSRIRVRKILGPDPNCTYAIHSTLFNIVALFIIKACTLYSMPRIN